MSRDVSIIDPILALEALFRYFNSHYGVAESCRILARHLRRQVYPRRRWGWQYIHQVLRHQIKPSKLLALAIFRLHQKTFTGAEPKLYAVSILAPLGFVTPKAVVMVRARKCALQTCQRPFIPVNPNQKFHSSACRKQEWRHRRSG